MSFKSFYEKIFLFKKKEKLSIVTILFIMFLNIIIVFSLYSIIDYQQKRLTSPNALFPNICRTIISNKSLNDFKHFFYNQKQSYSKNINNKCNVLINEKLLSVQNQNKIKLLKEKERILLLKQKNVLKELNYLRENYYNVLYGEVGNNPISKYIIIDNISLEKLKNRYEFLTKLNKEINTKKYSLYESFATSESFKSFELYIQKNKEYILTEYLKENNLHNLRKDLITFFTLLPLAWIFFFLMRRNKKKNQYIYFLISKIIVLILSFPIFLSFVFICSSLVPYEFVNKILEYNFPFYSYYIALFFSIVLLGVITARLQIKYQNDIINFKKESISKIDSYYKNICNVCVAPINYDTMNNCPVCDNQLKIHCPKCQRITIKDLSFCINCNADIKQEQFFTINQF